MTNLEQLLISNSAVCTYEQLLISQDKSFLMCWE